MIAPRQSDDSAKCVVGHDVHDKFLYIILSGLMSGL
jgi:hypothetical protein